MELSSPNFSDGKPIPGGNAFCVPDPENHVALADNRNPALAWRGVQIAYAQANSSTSNAELQQAIDDISRERSETLRAGRDQASRSFLLCGIDVDALTRQLDQESRDHDANSQERP